MALMFSSNSSMDYTAMDSANNATDSPGLPWTNSTSECHVNSSGAGNSSDTNQMRPETEQCRLFRFLLYTIVCGVFCLLGFVGNTLSFLVLQRDRSAPVASFLLQVMAVADNLFLLLWFIHYSIKDIFRYFEIDVQGHPAWIYVRVYTFPFLYMTQMETIWLTVVVAMNRYMAVCLPYRAPSLCTIHNVYKEVVVVTIFSILYNVPRFLELTVTANENTTTWARTMTGSDLIFQTLYIDAMYYLFTFVLPLLVLAFVNTRVIIAYRATQKRKRRMTSRRAENENNITLVMIMVVAIFMLCQAPARIVQLVWSYRYNHCEEFQYYLIHISNSLEVLNSSVNFLIYVTFRKRFRDILGEYYCTYAPLQLKNECRKSLTTEALALSEYQPTAAATGSSKDSMKKGPTGDSIRSHENTASMAVRSTVHANGHDDDLVPLQAAETQDKTTQVKAVSNGEISEREGDRGTRNAQHGEGELMSLVEWHDKPPQHAQEDNHNQELESRNNQAVESRSRDQPASDLIEYELSSENPVSRASSPDQDGVLNDGQMLIATV